MYRANESYDLRWFAQDAEIGLCRHAILAGAHVLWEILERGYPEKDETAESFTKIGMLTATFKSGWIETDLSTLPGHDTEAPEGLIEAPGIEPDMAVLARTDGRGIMFTSASYRGNYDLVSRAFAPR